ncbi:MAG: DUF4173 domain-containing protein [Chloroflexota bacterium]|nr:DUF4173 domain-containing protein [Chloroflexota bacterium]MDQ5866499.1 DUF4173 domain-containing protein [Chloroflexota bacterium]
MASQLTIDSPLSTPAHGVTATTTAPNMSSMRVLPNLASPSRVLMAGLGLGMAFDVLFYQKMLGISVPLFVGCLVGVLFWLGRQEDVRPRTRNLWIVLPLFFFAAMVYFRADGFLTFLNVVAVMGLMSLLAYFYAAGRLDRLGILGYYLSLMAAGLHSLTLPFQLVPDSLQGRRPLGLGRSRWLPVLRGVLLATPVLLVFAVLLSSADMVFAHLLGELLSFGFMPDMSDVFPQLIIALSTGWVLSGLLAYAVGRRERAASGDEEPWEAGMDSVPQRISIGFVEVTTVLVLVSGLFLAFGLVQFAYLFGGESNISAAGLTYAEYARRGFFELVAVSVLTLGLILGLHHLARRDTARERFIFNVMGSLMVALVLVLLASAYWRMSLYQQAYGYTHLRLYVEVFELWLAATFGWLLLTLWWKPKHFAIGAFVAALGFLATLNLANPDATIARENLERYRATGKLDVYYLAGLSEDAIPSLLPALDYAQGQERDALHRMLWNRLRHMEENPAWREWQALHWSRSEAFQLLHARRDELVTKSGFR